jgi:hypothetical protein
MLTHVWLGNYLPHDDYFEVDQPHEVRCTAAAITREGCLEEVKKDLFRELAAQYADDETLDWKADAEGVVECPNGSKEWMERLEAFASVKLDRQTPDDEYYEVWFAVKPTYDPKPEVVGRIHLVKMPLQR